MDQPDSKTTDNKKLCIDLRAQDWAKENNEDPSKFKRQVIFMLDLDKHATDAVVNAAWEKMVKEAYMHQPPASTAEQADVMFRKYQNIKDCD